MGEDVFFGTPRRMTIEVSASSIGWRDYEDFGEIPPWGARQVIGSGSGSGTSGGGSGDGEIETRVCLTVTNVVIHYVTQSLSSEVAVPITADTGIVNVMTEVKGGAVAIPDSWATNYPTFVTSFGSDFSQALTKPTGKFDGAGNAMLVWQDYVAGTDPTDPNSKFTASVTIVDGKPVISWSPELSTEEAAKRTYTTWGKAKLTDAKWVEVQTGQEGDYNFFKVTVEMR